VKEFRVLDPSRNPSLEVIDHTQTLGWGPKPNFRVLDPSRNPSFEVIDHTQTLGWGPKPNLRDCEYCMSPVFELIDISDSILLQAWSMSYIVQDELGVSVPGCTIENL
jgi:hypothetical protein